MDIDLKNALEMLFIDTKRLHREESELKERRKKLEALAERCGVDITSQKFDNGKFKNVITPDRVTESTLMKVATATEKALLTLLFERVKQGSSMQLRMYTT